MTSALVENDHEKVRMTASKVANVTMFTGTAL